MTDNNQAERMVTATYFATTSATPRPLVIVLPIWGSSRFPPRKTVRWLTDEHSSSAANVLWIDGAERLIDWQAGRSIDSENELDAVVDGWTKAIAGTVVDIRRLIDWAQTRPEVARGRVGVVGFSIGAIVGGLLAGTDERVDATVLVAGGANLHQILVACRGNTQRFREAVEARLGWSAEALETWLEPRLAPINPVAYAASVDPRSVLIIDADRDTCIPQSARDDLWLALGRPERLSLGYGHRKSFLAMTVLGFHFTSHEIIDFLDRTLLAPTARKDGGGRIEAVRTVAAGPDFDP